VVGGLVAAGDCRDAEGAAVTHLTEYHIPGSVKAGKLKVRRWREFMASAKKFKDGDVVITITTWKKRRSLEANSLYWVGFITPVAEFTGNEPAEIHAYFKRLFLPRQRIVLCDQNGEVLDEVEVEALTTTKLSPLEFSDYLRAIAGWAFEKCNGLVLKSNKYDEPKREAA
jgi:hypothetical protein